VVNRCSNESADGNPLIWSWWWWWWWRSWDTGSSPSGANALKNLQRGGESPGARTHLARTRLDAPPAQAMEHRGNRETTRRGEWPRVWRPSRGASIWTASGYHRRMRAGLRTHEHVDSMVDT